jgi:hypothetical protein
MASYVPNTSPAASRPPEQHVLELLHSKMPLQLDAGQGDAIAGAWGKRAATLETFYEKSKAW